MRLYRLMDSFQASRLLVVTAKESGTADFCNDYYVHLKPFLLRSAIL